MTEKHDEHYKKMDIEPIDVMEQIMRNDNISSVEALHLAIATSYIMRAGHKKDQPALKDIEKAKNHLHRALTSNWLPDEEDTRGVW